MHDFFISIAELNARIGTADAPVIFDVRRRPLFDAEHTILPTARWRDHTAADLWAGTLEPETEIVIHCVHGHNVSQAAAASLRTRGINASVLEGGIEGWRAAGAPLIHKSAVPHRDEDLPSLWVTATQPQIDHLACSWLVRRFIDRTATFLYVEEEHVVAVADELGGVSFGVPDATILATDGGSLFATCLDRFELSLPTLSAMAAILRAASDGVVDDVPEAAGVRAVLLGTLQTTGPSEQDVQERTFPMFDALYAWQSRTADST